MVYLELFVSFLIIGFTSFGGLSMIPLISSQMLSHGWMTAREVADIVAIAEMTPGPVGLNCATFAGSRAAGILGAAAATLGVITPSLTVSLAAAMFLKKFQENKYLANALYGIRPLCIGMIGAVVIQQSMVHYAGPLLGISWQMLLIGAAALLMLMKWHWSVPRVIFLSAALGLILG
ncbi:MAG: chromate transporter [Clostridia bacterium]|nr:chromate transporter [Clostridia bacterium]